MADFPFNYDELPNLDSLKAYVESRRPVGGFLKAVISNDLRGACDRADSKNIRLIPVYVCWLYNEAPAVCWGSPKKYEDWLNCEDPISKSVREMAESESY